MTRILKRFITFGGTTIAMLAAPQASADVLFYAQNGCRGPVAFRYPANSSLKESCKSDRAVCRGKNDEARSMKVTGTSRPSEVRLYDSPGGGSDDDYSVIQFRKFAPGYTDLCADTFERSGLLSNQGQIIYHRKNGLDGKVSYVVIYR